MPKPYTTTRSITPTSTNIKLRTSHTNIPKAPQPPKVLKPSIKTTPVPVGILHKSLPPKPPPPQTEVKKSLIYPNLKIPQTLPLLDLTPPDTKETIERYRSPDETLFWKPLPVLKDAKELDVFT